jgi:ATP phosphoribosyltransferase regulatory subunit
MDRDVELLALAFQLLEAAGCPDVQLHLSHAGIFRGLVAELGLKGDALRGVTAEIDRKDARGLATRLEELGVEGGLQEQVRVLSRCVGGRDVLDRARGSIRNTRSRSAIEALDALAGRLAPWHDRLTFDLAEIDEMEYYSGVMFTFFSPRLQHALGTGGRYDGFLQEFALDLPAIGFSFSLDGLLALR